MQNSELYRRGIVLPLDSEAENSLRYYGVDQDTRVKCLHIPDGGGFFETLWEIQLFDEINKRAGTCIDNHEEDFIEAEVVGEIEAAVQAVIKKNDSLRVSVQEFLQELTALSREARKLGRSIMFVL